MNEIADAVNAKSKASVVWGVVVLILGILAMMAPLAAGKFVVVMVGVALLVSGLSQTIYAFQSETVGAGVGKFLFGGLAVLCGLALLGNWAAGLAYLTIILAAFFLVDGIFTVISGFGIRPDAGWGVTVLGGIVSIILGWMIWSSWPVSGAWAVGLLVGIRLLFTGWAMIILGSAAKRMVEQAE
jgi:uncharacterized membrane protein HdeD (DUF308 family)